VKGKASKRNHGHSPVEYLQRSILQKEARINDNIPVDRVLAGTTFKRSCVCDTEPLIKVIFECCHFLSYEWYLAYSLEEGVNWDYMVTWGV
jgi:hypothetical protein